MTATTIRCTSGFTGPDGLWTRCPVMAKPLATEDGWVFDNRLDRCPGHSTGVMLDTDGVKHRNIIAEFKDIAISDMIQVRKRAYDEERWVDEDDLFARVVARLIELEGMRTAALFDVGCMRSENQVLHAAEGFESELHLRWAKAGWKRRRELLRQRMVMRLFADWYREWRGMK